MRGSSASRTHGAAAQVLRVGSLVGRSLMISLVALIATFPTVGAIDPQTHSSWNIVAPLPTARWFAAAAWSTGQLYAIGGCGFSDAPYLSNVEVYRPSKNSWTAVAPMSVARCLPAAATDQTGRIYAVGGVNAGTDEGRLNSAEVYDPRIGTWTPIAPMLHERYAFAAVAGADGRIYAIGGPDLINGGALRSVEVYNPNSNIWTEVAPLTTPRYGAAATLGLDGRIYVVGGNTCGLSGSCGLQTGEVYDPTSDNWSPIASMSTARSYLATATGESGKIYAIGGTTLGNGILNSVEAYDPQANTWGPAPPLPYPNTGLAATAAANRIYTLGGATDTTARTVALFTHS